MSVKSFEYQCFTDLITGHFTQRTLHVACLAVISGEEWNCDNEQRLRFEPNEIEKKQNDLNNKGKK